MDETTKTGTLKRYECPICGNSTRCENRPCNRCNDEIIAESDGYSSRSGRKDQNVDFYDEYNTRLNDGFNLESMAYKEY